MSIELILHVAMAAVAVLALVGTLLAVVKSFFDDLSKEPRRHSTVKYANGDKIVSVFLDGRLIKTNVYRGVGPRRPKRKR